MSAPRNAWGFTLFCDDLRQELSGKFSLMGLYTVDMVFPVDFPVTVSKIVFFVKYYEVKGAFSEDLELKIYFPWDDSDKPSISQTIKRSNMAGVSQKHPQIEDDAERINMINVPIILSPFTAISEGDIRVRITCGDVTTRLGRLILRKVTPEDNIQFSA